LAHGLKEEQLIFAPHAVDNDRFIKNADVYYNDAMSWRKAMGIEQNSIVFLFAGKFEPKKDPLLLLRSFIALQNTHTHLILVGNGVLEEELKRIANPYPNIHFLNFQNQTKMPVVYRLGDVFVLPSQGPGETWGLVVNEAMACSLPILTSNKVGCAADLVKENYNGYIFESGNFYDMVSKMQLMVDHNKSSLKDMGSNSLNLISEWSIKNLVDQILHAIENLKYINK
jgi:glycosyltransferase involved in cell wall biosynthesis